MYCNVIWYIWVQFHRLCCQKWHCCMGGRNLNPVRAGRFMIFTLGYMIFTLTREKYVVSAIYTGRECINSVSLLPHNVKHLRAPDGRILLNLFHGSNRVGMYNACTQSNIFGHNYISSWSDNCNICPSFRMESEGTESTFILKFRIYETKRWETTFFKPF